jgi:hypothetical protein
MMLRVEKYTVVPGEEDAPVREEYRFTNGWAVAVVAATDKGLFGLHGTAQTLVPRLVGWKIECESPAYEETPGGFGFDGNGLAVWDHIDELRRLLENVDSWTEYIEDRHCGSCDGVRC